MDDISPSELKTILHSKRANLYYLQHCRVLVNGGRVEYVTDEGRHSHYWNIPIANTTSLLLGTGTSITQAAMRELARAGVLVGFCGGGGTPLFSANEVDVEVSWLTPQSEYRPTEYLQRWVGFWFDEEKRLEAARYFQRARLERIRHSWLEGRLSGRAGRTGQPRKPRPPSMRHALRRGEIARKHPGMELSPAVGVQEEQMKKPRSASQPGLCLFGSGVSSQEALFLSCLFGRQAG
ncbi:type I-F CRISPR-associated endonuclease Cas1f [Pseudomonas aeruginosa]